jgi:hypothetical protein
MKDFNKDKKKKRISGFHPDGPGSIPGIGATIFVFIQALKK